MGFYELSFASCGLVREDRVSEPTPRSIPNPRCEGLLVGYLEIPHLLRARQYLPSYNISSPFNLLSEPDEGRHYG